VIRSSASGVLRTVLVSSLIVVGLFLVGCDSGGSNSSDGSNGGPSGDGSDDPSAQTVGEKATVEVGGSESSASSLKAKASGNGVVTVTYFYESNNEPCPAAASASVDPPATVELTPTEPDCKTGPKKGISVQYLSLGDSEDGLEIELRDGDEVISSATTSDGTARIEVEDPATEDESSGSGTFDWVGSWKRTFENIDGLDGDQAFELTETSFTIVRKGPNGTCQTTSGAIVDRSANTITTVENQAEVTYDVSVSSGKLTLTRKVDEDVSGGGVPITASEISEAPTTAIGCNVQNDQDSETTTSTDDWVGDWKLETVNGEPVGGENYYTLTAQSVKFISTTSQTSEVFCVTELFASVDGNTVTLQGADSAAPAELSVSEDGNTLTIKPKDADGNTLNTLKATLVDTTPECTALESGEGGSGGGSQSSSLNP